MAELVLALDLPTAKQAMGVLELCPGVVWVKLGSVLFTATGPSLIAELERRGLRVFLDLKWHDIPNTVRGAVGQARSLGVDMVTVHALGGGSMLEAAKEAAGPDLAVVAVTVLTSHTPGSFGEAVGRDSPDLAAEVERLARAALASGLDGVVASPLEASRLRTALGDKPLLVTPGIRRAEDEAGDQARVATVSGAVRAGATHLVVGRPVVEAPDPGAAWAALAAELAQCR